MSRKQKKEERKKDRAERSETVGDGKLVEGLESANESTWGFQDVSTSHLPSGELT